MHRPIDLLERLMNNLRSTRGDVRYDVVMRMFDIGKNEALNICVWFGHDPFAVLPPFDDNVQDHGHLPAKGKL
jgi:hypothetical protein